MSQFRLRLNISQIWLDLCGVVLICGFWTLSHMNSNTDLSMLNWQFIVSKPNLISCRGEIIARPWSTNVWPIRISNNLSAPQSLWQATASASCLRFGSPFHNIYIRLLCSKGKTTFILHDSAVSVARKWRHCLLNKITLIGQRNVVWPMKTTSLAH